MITSAQQSIARQRGALTIFLKAPLSELASACAQAWDNTEALWAAIRAGFADLPYCNHLYVMDLNGIQLTAQMSSRGEDRQTIGLDRSLRPYMNNVLPLSDFILSEACIGEYEKRPGVTAVQMVKRDAKLLGFLGRILTCANCR